MNPTKTIRVIQLGLGQQGTTNVKKFAALREAGYPIELLAVVETDQAKFEKEVLPGKKLADLFPEAQKIAMRSQDFLQSLGSRRLKNGRFAKKFNPDAIFDSTNTAMDGCADNHGRNLKAIAAAALDYELAVKAYGIEKPAAMSTETLMSQLGWGALQDLTKKGISVIPNAVESFGRTKQAVREDMKRRGIRPVKIDAFRMSATQTKSVATGRLIIQKFGGAKSDKSPHDVMEDILLISETCGTLPDSTKPYAVNVIGSNFDTLEIKSPDGTLSRVTYGGLFVPKNPAPLSEDAKQRLAKSDGELREDYSNDGPNSGYWTLEAIKREQGILGETGYYAHRNTAARNFTESYADFTVEIAGIECRFVASHLGIKSKDAETMQSWFTPAMQEAVAKAANAKGQARTPESIQAAYGENGRDIEARVAKVTCSDGSSYVTQTFAKGGGPFAVRIDPNGSATVLDYSPTPYDSHLEWVRNVIEVATGKSQPAISHDAIALETLVLEIAESPNSDRQGHTEVLDLGDPKNAELAAKLQPELMAAGCWEAPRLVNAQ